MPKRIRTTGLAPRHPGDTSSSALNEVVLALAAEMTEMAEGVSVHQIHNALGNSDLPPSGLGMTMRDHVRAGRLVGSNDTSRIRTYRITALGKAWLDKRGVVSKGMVGCVSRGAEIGKLKYNTGVPRDMPIPTMTSVSGQTGTTREWLGLDAGIAGEGKWAWANLNTSKMHARPRRYRSASPTPDQPGNEMTPRIVEALASGGIIPPMGISEAARLRSACQAMSVNVIRRTMENGTATQNIIVKMLTTQARRLNPRYPATRFGEILRGRLLPDADEAQAIALMLGVPVVGVAPHLTVASWLQEQRASRATTTIPENACLRQGRLSEDNRHLVEAVMAQLGTTLHDATLDHLDKLIEAARREGPHRKQDLG